MVLLNRGPSLLVTTSIKACNMTDMVLVTLGSDDLTSAHTVDYYGLKVQTTGISRDTHLHIKQNSEEQKEQEEVLDKAQEGEGEGHGEEGGGGHGREE